MSSTYSTFDHSQNRQSDLAKKAQPIPYVEKPALQTQYTEKSKLETLDGVSSTPPQPIRTHAVDVLSPSTQITVSPLSAERPKLIPPDAPTPRALSEYRFLKLMNEIKDRSNAITETMSKRIDIYKREIDAICAENIKQLKANAEKAASSQWWAMIKKIATALVTALSIGLGFALLASGGSVLAGGALVASGVLALANFACNEAGLWDELAKKLAQGDEERRKKIGLILPIAVSVLSCALGLYGGLQNIALTTPSLMNNIVSFTQMALGTFQGATQIGSSFARSDLIRSDADLSSTQASLNIERIHLAAVTKWIENFIAEMKGINEKASQVTRMVIDANQRVVQFQA